MQLYTPCESYAHAAKTKDTATQIIMLYDAAINYVKQAKAALGKDDHDTRYQLIDKAMAVLRGLRVCLDFSACEEVAEAMEKYYDALDGLLVAVQCNPDAKLCDAIIENLRIVKNTWASNNPNLTWSDISATEDEERSDILI